LAAAPTARACDGFGYGWGYGMMYQSMAYRVPYFAAFPPVYYSYPVPRTYGYSPFAYPPHVMTPDVVLPSPQVFSNPYVPVEPVTPAKPPQDRATATERPGPLVVVNPFVAAVAVAKTDR
jgi:hypothetical protein